MSNPVLREAMTGEGGSAGRPERVHLIGLVSDGGVHSGFGHLEALIEMAAELEVEELIIHAFTDGRDTLPTSGAGYPGDGWSGWLVGGRAGPDRLGGGPLLGDGPRSPLGAHPGGLRPARSRPGRAPRGHGRGRGPRGLRARRDRRVHPAGAGGGRGSRRSSPGTP